MDDVKPWQAATYRVVDTLIVAWRIHCSWRGIHWRGRVDAPFSGVGAAVRPAGRLLEQRPARRFTAWPASRTGLLRWWQCSGCIVGDGRVIWQRRPASVVWQVRRILHVSQSSFLVAASVAYTFPIIMSYDQALRG